MKSTLRNHWNEFVLWATGLAVVIRFLNDPDIVRAAVSSVGSFFALFVNVISSGIIAGTVMFWVWYLLVGRKEEKRA